MQEKKIEGVTVKDAALLRKAAKVLSKEMPANQMERRIMATVNGVKVLIIAAREQAR